MFFTPFTFQHAGPLTDGPIISNLSLYLYSHATILASDGIISAFDHLSNLSRRSSFIKIHSIWRCTLMVLRHNAVLTSNGIFAHFELLWILVRRSSFIGMQFLWLYFLPAFTHQCSSIGSCFPSIFTMAAFPHTSDFAYDHIFSLCSYMLLFNQTNVFFGPSAVMYNFTLCSSRIWSHFYSHCSVATFSHTAIDVQERFFASARYAHALLSL